jgi:dUTPase
MILTLDTFHYIVEKQKILDAAFLPNSRWLPNFEDRELALAGERGEFLNEFTDEIRWWKHKENDSTNIIDECLDAWLFGSQIIYSDFVDTEEQREKLYEMIAKDVERFTEKVADKRPDKRLRAMLPILAFRANNWIAILAAETYMLELMGYTDADMRESHHRVTKKNFERIASGY